MVTFFSVRNQDLDHLSPNEAVDLLRELLWAEASVLGIGKHLINVPSAITVRDGGVDAEVQNPHDQPGQGLIKQGLTRYQVKTGEFQPSKPSNIGSILYTCTNKSRVLKPRVKSCLDNNGTLVVVLFGWDDPEPRDAWLSDKFRQELASIDQTYQDARIEIWPQNKVIGFLKAFPSLALRVTGRNHARFQTHWSWSQQDDMRNGLKAGAGQSDLISNIQTELRRGPAATHVRVWGEPGIGKTRLVLEATRANDLRPLVIYCDSAEKFKDSDLMSEILKDDNDFSVILVIDECDEDSRSYIWNKFKHLGLRIKVISIFSELDPTTGNIAYFDIPPLDDEQISCIIQDYGIPKDQADRWSDLCSGSPRVAHVIGSNLQNNPEDLLRSPDTVMVWERYICGRDDPGSQQVRERRSILQHIALFKRFGYGRTLVKEAQAIARMVERAEPQISWTRFQATIGELRRRKLLQGETTLYITPKALHIKLWIDWWNIYGNTFDLNEFAEPLPPQLLERFHEMFKYATASEVASQVVAELLGNRGPFQHSEFLKTSGGGRFFLALTEANPPSALACLKRTVGTWNKRELLQFTTGRREVVWALERIAIWKDLFADAARLLLALGESENETWTNNASGIFAGLFSLGYGKVAPTEAAPHERFAVLKEALESGSKERRLLALRACDVALEAQHFSRSVGAEHQGLRREPELWTPRTWGEVFDSYRHVWELLREKIKSLPSDERQQAIEILLDRARGLATFKDLEHMILDTFEELSQSPHIDKKALLTRVIHILRYEGKSLPQESKQRWERLKAEVTGSGYSSLMRRYVGMHLLEEQFDDREHRVDLVQPRIEELAQQSVDDEALLRPELAWLVTADAENGYGFGYELGKRDQRFALLPALLEAQRHAVKNPSAYFLGGYFRALFEKDKQKWEEQLDVLCEDSALGPLVPELTWRSGVTDRAALRVLKLARTGLIGAAGFRLFCFGGVVRNLSEETFRAWINFLLESPEASAISTALNLYDFYCLRKEVEHSMPAELTLRLLTDPSLVRKSDQGRSDQMDDHHWTEIGRAFVELYPEKSLPLADMMLEHFGEEGTIFESYYSTTHAVLNEISRRYPGEVWILATRYLGPPIDSRAFHIKAWLRGGEFFEAEEGALPAISLEKIWEWVDGDIEKRARYLAHFVPPRLFRQEGKVCLAREVLVRYGTREDVRSNLRANFSSEGWTGPASLHYQGKKQGLLAFKEGESDENVRRWIDEYVTALNQQIEQAKIEEERRGF